DHRSTTFPYTTLFRSSADDDAHLPTILAGMLNLGRLRCLQPGCARERPLLVQPDGLLVCPSCGAARPAPEYFRVYRGRSGQWIKIGRAHVLTPVTIRS